MGGEGAECVKVAIRCRPPSTKEINNGEKNIVEMTESFSADSGEQGQVVLNDPAGVEEPGKFAFDIVFGLKIMQEQVYESVGRPALNKTFEGYNGTIFAYGQTGSGKSFSMSGVPNDPVLRGITPRMCEELFSRIAKEQDGTSRRFFVMCSYFEIYNEIIFDLLNPVADRSKIGGGLQVKEHPVMGIYVKDLSEIMAKDAAKLEDMLESGQKNRAVSSTMMNATSSRSHSIFTVKVHQKDEEDASRNVFAKLNLVDLAGSERQKGTGATGQTLKEGANINKSLSALGNVINALVECANGKKVFIPYRNSKLTRVLQESLGGNSLCTMLAALSPAACNYEETMSTLRYANRAKAIKVSATKNEEASQISRLKAEVEELKKKLAASGGSGGGGGGGGGLTDEERREEQDKYQKQLKEMESMMSSNWSEKAKLSEEHENKMKKLVEERKRAAQAVEDERAKRLRLLQEKNDLELSVRGFLDFVVNLPKAQVQNSPVLSGEEPRRWLKTLRVMRQTLDELKEQRTMVLVFKHALDEDVKLWGEGAEADDVGLASTALNRCLPKLDKLQKGGEKLLQLESECLSTASELAEALKHGTTAISRFEQTAAEEAPEGNDEDAKARTAASMSRMLSLMQKQLQEKIDELTQQAMIDMGQTCELVLRFSRSSASAAEAGGNGGAAADAEQHCQALQALVADPGLASLPPFHPGKPLHEYGPEDISDTPETTAVLLGKLIQLEALGGKTKKPLDLLTRPPPKFVLDLTWEVKKTTGFPASLENDWPDEREGKLARLQGIADAVGGALNVPVDFFDPADVLKGKSVPKTLRLMQLLAIAAGRQKPEKAEAKPDRPATGADKGLTPARVLPPMFSAMERCLQGAKVQVDKKREATSKNVDGGEQSLEEKIRELERQLQEEGRARRQQEAQLAGTERTLQETQAEVRKLENECRLAEGGGGNNDPEKQELQRQVSDLLKDASAPVDEGGSTGDAEQAVLNALAAQLEEVRREIDQDSSKFADLEVQLQQLHDVLGESVSQSKQLEAEVQRERQRCETEQELMGQSPEEQKLILQAHEQKLRTRAGTLEAQIAVVAGEAEERKAANLRIGQESKDLQAAVEDTQLQMQIVQEERDSLREAYERLWNEKASVDTDLEDLEQGYIGLSERKAAQEDKKGELETQVENMRLEVARLQKNGFDMLDKQAAARS